MNALSRHLIFKYPFSILFTGLLLFLGLSMSGAARVQAKPSGDMPSSSAAPAGFHWEYQIEFNLATETDAADKIGRLKDKLSAAGVSASLDPLNGFQTRLTLQGDRDLAQLRQALYVILQPQFNLFQEPWMIDLLFPEAAARQVTLKLESLPGTGYEWLLKDPEESGFQQAGATETVDLYEIPGTPAQQTLRFDPISSEATALELIYRRPFGEVLPSRAHLTIQMAASTSLIDLSDPNPPQAGSASTPEQVENSRSAPEGMLAPAVVLPSSFDWRTSGKVTPIRDQGGCGSCWAFGTTAVMESALSIYNGTSADLSEQFLLSCNVASKNKMCGSKYTCSGGCVDAQDYHTYETGEGQTDIGAVLESDFPYTATDSACPAGLNHPYKAADWYFVGGDYPTVDQIKTAIYTYGPVTTEVCAANGFFTYTGGVFTEDNICSNHQVALVGWDDATQTWILKNSWGTGWGEAGYMHIRWGVSNVGLRPSFVTYQHQIFGKTSPANYAFNQPTSLNLTWEASAGATSYEYCVDTNNNGTCDGSWVNNGTSTTASLSGLSAGARYYWHVRANSPSGLMYSNYNDQAWWTFRIAGCGGGLCVTVTDEAGNSLGNVEVAALTNLSAYPSYWNYTDETGFTQLNISSGAYSLVVASTSNNFVVVKNVTAPGNVMVDPTGTVQVTVNAKVLGGGAMRSAGISALPSAHGPGYFGDTNASGSLTGRVTPGLTYSFTAWGWNDLYYLGKSGVSVTGPTTVNLYADNMPTGKLQVNLDNFPDGYFIPWSSISDNSTASYYFTSGQTFTLSTLYYDDYVDLAKNGASGYWEYDLYKAINIASGDNQIRTFGGNFILTTQTDRTSYIAGGKVTINNTFTDSYGNRLSGIYNFNGVSATPRDPVQEKRSGSDRERPASSSGGNRQGWNYIYPRLWVTDPNGSTIFNNQTWYNWYSNSFFLPVPGVVGTHTVHLSLETGPYNGSISTANTFNTIPGSSTYLPLVLNNFPIQCNTVPTLIYPTNGSSLNNLIPLYQWDNGQEPNATAARFQVARDPGFTQIATEWWIGLAYGPYQLRDYWNLDPGTVYYWRTWLMCGNDVQGPYSPTWSFTSGSAGVILPAPNLLSPPNGAVLPGTSTTLQWSAVSGAVEYFANWWIPNYGGYLARTTSTSLVPWYLDPNSTFQWTAAARNDYAWGNDSVTWTFTTGAGASPGSATLPPSPGSDHPIYLIDKDGRVVVITGK